MSMVKITTVYSLIYGFLSMLLFISYATYYFALSLNFREISVKHPNVVDYLYNIYNNNDTIINSKEKIMNLEFQKLELIKKYIELYNEGSITEEEFLEKKTK